MTTPDRSPGRNAPTVVLTRSPEDNAALAKQLRADGLRVLEWPAIASRAQDVTGGLPALRQAIHRADVVAFTSRRGIQAASALIPDLPTLLAGKRLAAVGSATRGALETHGLRAEWVGPEGSDALAAILVATLARGTRVLLLRSEAANDTLPSALREAGLEVEDLRPYALSSPARPEADEQPLAAVVCASPSAARRVIDWHPWSSTAPFVAIGTTTARCLRELGVAQVEVASGTDVESLRRAVLKAAFPEISA